MSSCGYCESSEVFSIAPTYDMAGRSWSLSECKVCSAQFLDPPPSPSELSQSYDSEYYGTEEAKFDGWVGKARSYFSQQRAKAISRLVPPPARVLDIGCGSGEFLVQLREHGYDCSGIELESAAARLRELKNIEFNFGSISEMELPEGEFDFISLWHVFEHLPHGKQNLKKMVRALRPGGCLALAVPNVASVQASIFGGHWFHWDPPRHLFLLSRDALLAEAESFGLTLCHERSYLMEYDPFGFQQSVLNFISPNRRDRLYENVKAGSSAESNKQDIFDSLEKCFFYATAPLAVTASVFESTIGRGGTIELYFRRAIPKA